MSPKHQVAIAAVFSGLAFGQAEAQLDYTVHRTDTGSTFVIVSGKFEYSDDLSKFRDLVSREHAVIVGFDSPGGNVAKAMELGRMIRSFNLSTVQVRQAECASACSLAFLGGTSRLAEPGSIGVHKSSFGDTEGLHIADAVSAVQQTTAEIIGYMSEMGVDPGLLQLSLSYDSDDIRYLSGSEMSKYKVTTPTLPPLAGTEVEKDRTLDRPAGSSGDVQARSVPSLTVPDARTGVVRHPKGEALLKNAANPDARSDGAAKNGSEVNILDKNGDWYQVKVGGRVGYMHYSWVRVNQFEEPLGDGRFVQVRSFGSLPEARDYITKSALPLVGHLAANGWIAVTLRDTYPERDAKDVSNALKAHGLIPKDSMVTYGNTYVRKVCCD